LKEVMVLAVDQEDVHRRLGQPLCGGQTAEPGAAPTMTTRGRSPSTPARGTSFKRFYSNDCVEREAMRFYPLLPIVAGVAQNATAALNSAA
jgi:hypothetical protein